MTKEAISYLVRPVAKKNKLGRVYLFGSYARGEAGVDSDIDLVIEGGDFKSLFDLVRLQSEFKKALGKDVDVVEKAALHDDTSRSGRRFRSHFERDKVLLYENR